MEGRPDMEEEESITAMQIFGGISLSVLALKWHGFWEEKWEVKHYSYLIKNGRNKLKTTIYIEIDTTTHTTK